MGCVVCSTSSTYILSLPAKAVSHAWGFPLSLDRVVHLYYLIINNFLSDATTTSTNISVRGRVRI